MPEDDAIWLSDRGLLALQRMSDATTPSPWHVEGLNVWGNGQIVAGVSLMRTDGIARMSADAQFIAFARDVLPLLIAEIRRLRDI